MKPINIFLLLVCFTSSAAGKIGYFEYHAQVNKAESLYFIANRPAAAFKVYDDLLSCYDFVFVRDFYVAAQIACTCNDRKRVSHYLDACFKNGLRLEQLGLSPVFKEYGFTVSADTALSALYERDRNQYLAHLNQGYRAKMYQLYSEDQIDKHGPNKSYRQSIQAHMQEFLDDIAVSGFPGAKLIGIDDATVRVKGLSFKQWYQKVCSVRGVAIDEYHGNGEDASLASCTFIPFLLHHPCAYEKIQPFIRQEIAKGNLHPRDVGLLHDNIMRLGAQSRMLSIPCKAPGKYFFKLNSFCAYPANWRKDRLQIDSLRATLNICSLLTDSLKNQKMTALGFYHDFGFWSCR